MLKMRHHSRLPGMNWTQQNTMNKYLMLTIAAALASTASASADTYCFILFTSGSNCDGGKVQTKVDGGALSGSVRAWAHTNNNCVGATSQGQGLLAKTPGLGKVSLMSDNMLAKNYGIYSEQLSYALPKKIREGAKWTMWVGLSGISVFEGNYGTLYDVRKGQNCVVGHGRKSTLDGVKGLIAAHRNAKAPSK
jgi:hypothetical protein